ncbi:MAG: CoA transferase [Rhodobiaceae bacterium]|nr:CoA transferase [Rhodobiaceae bacterium]MCC0055934.1 CoA transferase [Rhodobiaceae bacterium]
MTTDANRFENTPLGGLKVLDFTHFVAGPLATMILADAGADVIKVEKPTGDDQRHFAPREEKLGGQGPSFLWGNRNKRGVTLDMKSEKGREIAHALVAKADVLVENFSSRVMKQYGLDYESVKAFNPGIIYCSVSAFGRTGEYADRLGFDPVMQAESGFMGLSGWPQDPGMRAGAPLMDIATGMMASNAVLIALAAKARTGKGQFVEVPLYDTSIIMTGFAAMNYLMSGRIPVRTGNASNDSVPSGILNTADKPIFVSCASTVTFRRLFADVLGMKEIAEEPALQEGAGRLDQRERIYAILNEAFSKDTRANWLKRLAAANIPAGAVNELPDALDGDIIASRGMISHIPHPQAGTVPNIALPLYFGETPVVKPTAAPTLGQHNEEVVRDELGYSGAEIKAAKEAGAFGPKW